MDSNKLTTEQKIEKLQSMLAKAKPENPLQFLLYWNKLLFTQSGPLDDNIIKNIAENPTNKIIENPLDKIIEQRKLKDKEQLEQIKQEIKKDKEELKQEIKEQIETEIKERALNDGFTDLDLIPQPKEQPTKRELEYYQAKGIVKKMEHKWEIMKAIAKLDIDNDDNKIKMKKKDFAQIIAEQFQKKVSYILKVMQLFHNKEKLQEWLKLFNQYKDDLQAAFDKMSLLAECLRLKLDRFFKKYLNDRFVRSCIISFKKQLMKSENRKKVFVIDTLERIDILLT